MSTKNPHWGTTLDAFLAEDGTRETTKAEAINRVVAWQLTREMERQGITKAALAKKMHTSRAQLDRAITEIEAAPGIVLFTLVDPELSERLQEACRDMGSPCLSVLQPIFDLFESYLGASSASKPGAQHMLNAEYFKRIDALNFTMMHDDGQQPQNIEDADVLLLGVSRTSKTPTSIYLANRGIKTANIPLVPNVPLPPGVEQARNPLVVGLVASPERIVQIRQNRLLALNADQETSYVDRISVAEEIAHSRRLCAAHGWPMIDVTRRSIEETAAAIIDLHKEHRLKLTAQS